MQASLEQIILTGSLVAGPTVITLEALIILIRDHSFMGVAHIEIQEMVDLMTKGIQLSLNFIGLISLSIYSGMGSWFIRLFVI